MRCRRIAVLLGISLLTGCSSMQQPDVPIAGVVGSALVADSIGLLSTPYLANGLIAYAIYDPLRPNWTIEARRTGENQILLDMQMKLLVSGGEGEARQVFMRTARKLVEEGGYAGFDVIRYEESIESSRPFARRIANGEIRLVKSRQFPML